VPKSGFFTNSKINQVFKPCQHYDFRLTARYGTKSTMHGPGDYKRLREKASIAMPKNPKKLLSGQKGRGTSQTNQAMHQATHLETRCGSTTHNPLAWLAWLGMAFPPSGYFSRKTPFLVRAFFFKVRKAMTSHAHPCPPS
jgi:hypothetical protein